MPRRMRDEVGAEELVRGVAAEQRVASAKQFIEQLNEEKLWKLVFLTLKLKS